LQLDYLSFHWWVMVCRISANANDACAMIRITNQNDC
jgi:hypothetical protein